jgi:hypothetical protein
MPVGSSVDRAIFCTADASTEMVVGYRLPASFIRL